MFTLKHFILLLIGITLFGFVASNYNDDQSSVELKDLSVHSRAKRDASVGKLLLIKKKLLLGGLALLALKKLKQQRRRPSYGWGQQSYGGWRPSQSYGQSSYSGHGGWGSSSGGYSGGSSGGGGYSSGGYSSQGGYGR